VKKAMIEGVEYVRVLTEGCTWCAFMDRPTTCERVIEQHTCTSLSETVQPDGSVVYDKLRNYSWVEPERLIKLKLKGLV